MFPKVTGTKDILCILPKYIIVIVIFIAVSIEWSRSGQTGTRPTPFTSWSWSGRSSRGWCGGLAVTRGQVGAGLGAPPAAEGSGGGARGAAPAGEGGSCEDMSAMFDEISSTTLSNIIKHSLHV